MRKTTLESAFRRSGVARTRSPTHKRGGIEKSSPLDLTPRHEDGVGPIPTGVCRSSTRILPCIKLLRSRCKAPSGTSQGKCPRGGPHDPSPGSALRGVSYPARPVQRVPRSMSCARAPAPAASPTTLPRAASHPRRPWRTLSGNHRSLVQLSDIRVALTRLRRGPSVTPQPEWFLQAESAMPDSG